MKNVIRILILALGWAGPILAPNEAAAWPPALWSCTVGCTVTIPETGKSTDYYIHVKVCSYSAPSAPGFWAECNISMPDGYSQLNLVATPFLSYPAGCTVVGPCFPRAATTGVVEPLFSEQSSQ